MHMLMWRSDGACKNMWSSCKNMCGSCKILWNKWGMAKGKLKK